ncbi:MAG: M56 family metallopeptidase, partial [Planctomycetales bacterium]|nr:M56 family metallopeptidase [Planctomycetales bacterium]
MNQTHFSEIGQRIIWTLVHSVWQFALVALLLASTLWFIRGRSPHLRYGLILAAMLGMVITPPATFLMVSPEIQTSRSQIAGMATGMQSNAGRAVEGSGYPVPNQHVAPPLAADASAVVDLAIVPKAKGFWAKSTTDEFRAAIVAFVDRWMDTILACWLGGILILSIRPLIGWRATCALRSRGRDSVSDSIATATKRIAERLGVRRAIEVTQSTIVEVPTVIGWLKPLVLLPASAISGLSSEQLDAVIAHELAHVRRNDYLVNLFQLVMETVFFYHPAVWWVSHCMRVEREECCDDVAVKMTGDRIGYAKLLVWLEETRTQPVTAPLGMSSGGGS